MGSLSQGNKVAVRLLVGTVKIALVAGALFGVSVLLAKQLTKPLPREPQKIPSDRTETPHLTLAGDAVDLELITPDGKHAFTGSSVDPAITKSMDDVEARVDCSTYAGAKSNEQVCTATILMYRPPLGDYKVIVSGAEERNETITIGWGGLGFRRSGGLPISVAVVPGRPLTLTIRVFEDGVVQRMDSLGRKR
jgi:hypothetical protein